MNKLLKTTAVMAEQKPVLKVELPAGALRCRDDVNPVSEGLQWIVDQHPGENVLLDFSAVVSMDSGVLGGIIRFRRKFTPSGGKIRLFGMQREIREEFKITSLDRVFEIFNSEAEALAAWAAS